MTEVISIEAPEDVFEPAFDFVPSNISTKAEPARVKWLNPEVGYGFVNTYGSNDDIFIGKAVLHKSILGEIQAGQAVSI